MSTSLAVGSPPLTVMVLSPPGVSPGGVGALVVEVDDVVARAGVDGHVVLVAELDRLKSIHGDTAAVGDGLAGAVVDGVTISLAYRRFSGGVREAQRNLARTAPTRRPSGIQ